jgi:hypothetical protein
LVLYSLSFLQALEEFVQQTAISEPSTARIFFRFGTSLACT